MRAAAALWAVAPLCAFAAAGCRATPGVSGEDLAVDLGAGGDDLGGDDLAVADLGCPVGPEVCGNGCDDDRNGYTDADDPACTTQMLVTLQLGSPSLSRLVLEPTPHLVVLDGNPIGSGAMAAYNGAFAPAAFVAFDSGTKQLWRVPFGGGTTTMTSTLYSTRDACVFNGELIVVDPRSGGSFLHRFLPDGKTELGVVPVANIATACSSDGTRLYVARHATVGNSELAVFAKSGSGPVDTGVVVAVPDALATAGYGRIVDLAYVKRSGLFIGLFSTDLASADSSLDGQLMAPFALDGGVGAFIDGGVWHGVGEFLP